MVFSYIFYSWKKSKKIKIVEQEDAWEMPKYTEERPVFAGLRVVELATVVAAPTAARVMAELGAEVVKVEEPKGDFFRKFFLE